MRKWYQLIAASLVVMALMAPSLSLAICNPASADSTGSMKCPPDCPMMTNSPVQESGAAMTGIDSQPPACCAIRSSIPAPVSVATVIVPAVAVNPRVTVSSIAPSVVSAPAHQTDTSPPPIAGKQDLLCVFLI